MEPYHASPKVHLNIAMNPGRAGRGQQALCGPLHRALLDDRFPAGHRVSRNTLTVYFLPLASALTAAGSGCTSDLGLPPGGPANHPHAALPDRSRSPISSCSADPGGAPDAMA